MHGYDWEVPGGHISSTIPISVRFFVCIGITADCGRGNKVLENGFHERKVYENVMRIPWRLDTYNRILEEVSSTGMSYISDWQHTNSDIDSSQSFAFGTL